MKRMMLVGLMVFSGWSGVAAANVPDAVSGPSAGGLSARARRRRIRQAAHRFRHPRAPDADVPAEWGRFGAADALSELHAIASGMTKAQVKRLLGPPDDAASADYWDYATGPVSSFMVQFENGRVVWGTHGGDEPPDELDLAP